MMIFYLVSSVLGTLAIKAGIAHFLSLQVVTVWYHHEKESKIEKLSKEITLLQEEYEKLTGESVIKGTRPARSKEYYQMRSLCRSSSVYRNSRGCREWRKNNR